jgi:hypothetical protein
VSTQFELTLSTRVLRHLLAPVDLDAGAQLRLISLPGKRLSLERFEADQWCEVSSTDDVGERKPTERVNPGQYL